jgi:hypothetical protein
MEKLNETFFGARSAAKTTLTIELLAHNSLSRNPVAA